MIGNTALRRELQGFCKGLDAPPDVAGRCPCGGLFAASRKGGVSHSLPSCGEFEAKEPDKYLRFVRVRYSQ